LNVIVLIAFHQFFLSKRKVV